MQHITEVSTERLRAIRKERVTLTYISHIIGVMNVFMYLMLTTFFAKVISAFAIYLVLRGLDMVTGQIRSIDNELKRRA